MQAQGGKAAAKQLGKEMVEQLTGVPMDINIADMHKAAKKARQWHRKPQSLEDRLVWEEVMKNNSAGGPIMTGLVDKKFSGMDKWSFGKKSSGGANSEAHWVVDPKTNLRMDFKMKHSTWGPPN